jgi:hypothetical protein
MPLSPEQMSCEKKARGNKAETVRDREITPVVNIA